LETLEASSIDFYVMLQSVVTQKRDAELKEALAQSGWTTFSSARTLEPASTGSFQKPESEGAVKPGATSGRAVQ